MTPTPPSRAKGNIELLYHWRKSRALIFFDVN
jgi:hypothetical protein